GPYVRRMIPEPGDTNREVPVNETFHVQTDDELTEKELKQIEADDQAIQTILLGLPEDIYAAEKKAKLFNEWERFTSNDGESIESYYHRILKLMNDLKRNKHFPEKIARNLNGYNDVENVRNQVVHNAIQNLRVRNVGNHNGLISVPGNANQNLNRNGNLVAVRAEGNAAGHNGNQIRCYNYRGVGHFTRNCTYIELLEPIPETHQVPQNDNNVISKVPSVEQIEVEKVNTVNPDESLAKYKALELEIECLLRAAISQDIMSDVQKTSVVDKSNLQTELERTKERFENYIIKKENEYAKLWNYWYKKCEECKFDKISYDKAYKDMQQKFEWLQAQLGDLKGKSKDTSCVSDTYNPLSQKLENENVELEFQVLNYAKENAHLNTTYKNLFDSISVSHTQTKTLLASLQKQLHTSIYENAKLRAQLFNEVSEQKDNKRGTSANTEFAKQSIVGNLPMFGMFRIRPFKTSREEKHVPNKVRASARTKLITVSQPHVITKKDVNSDSNGLSSTGIDNTKTRRP
nr:hypothetical protein [Tanacetum cinerariifolium]